MKTFVPTISNWMRQRSSQSSPMAIISCGGGSAHNRATYLIANPSPSLKSVESSWEVGRDLTIVTFVRANANVPNLEVTILLHLIHYIVNLCTATLNSVEVAVTTSMSSMSQSFNAKCAMPLTDMDCRLIEWTWGVLTWFNWWYVTLNQLNQSKSLHPITLGTGVTSNYGADAGISATKIKEVALKSLITSKISSFLKHVARASKGPCSFWRSYS